MEVPLRLGVRGARTPKATDHGAQYYPQPLTPPPKSGPKKLPLVTPCLALSGGGECMAGG